MKFVAISSNMNWRSKKMDIVHRLLFHGHAIRADAPTNPTEWRRGTWSHNVGDDLSQPLLLQRSGVHIPPIFNPGVALVIREELYQRIRDFPGVVVAEARPSKLINLWKSIGDFSLYESTDPFIRANLCRPDMLLDWMPNDPDLFAKFPRCYELVGYNVAMYRGEETHNVKVSFVMNNDRETKVDWSCPASKVNTYPLLWGSVFFIRYDLFELIKAEIDSDNFAIRPIEL